MSPPVHLNPLAKDWVCPASHTDVRPTILAFHQTLPDYSETPLRSLPALARELGLAHVLLKDESSRFGLPAFKILGASWSVYRVVGAALGLDQDAVAAGAVSVDALGAAARAAGLSLVTCTDGNCGRAIARMARYLGVAARVLVPAFVDEPTRARIRAEGAEVAEVRGSYDDAVAVARKEEEAEPGRLMILDVALEGFEMAAKFFVQGYQTMLAESDHQVLAATGGKAATHAFVPCGAGSISQAVTEHFKSAARSEQGASTTAAVIAVEPTTAACLRASLEAGRSMSVPATEATIMCGMNCGTLSTLAWPVLRQGVDAAVVVTDREAHEAVEELRTAAHHACGVAAGPCGAATVAALRRTCADARAREGLGLGSDAVAVLFCTEGAREYPVPA